MTKKEENAMPKSSYGKGNQRVTPGWASWSTRKSDGKDSVVFGKKGSSSHGHSVRGTDGRLDYSRSISGRKRYDSGR
jgi:hypothetical protein